MMGRKMELEVKIPNLFRCPISLDVMRSPVSLCTGVTYDRASIQRWLDSGHTTCPATMQPLPSTDLVPNLTLRRLIHHWSATDLNRNYHLALLGDLLSSRPDPLPALRRLSAFLSDPDADDFAKNSLAAAPGFAAALASAAHHPAAVEVADAIFASDCVEEGSKQALAADLRQSIPALIGVLNGGSDLESRIRAARVLDLVIRSLPDVDSKARIAEKTDLIPALIQLAGAADRAAVEAAVGGLLAATAGVRRARVRMVRHGLVPAMAAVLAGEAAAAGEGAMRLMEAAAGCAEGREAICEGAGACVAAVLGRMMKVGREGTESAVAVLWSVCHLFRDRRAQEAVAAASGGIAKFLMVMQSGCSPATRQMAGDLLKMFRVSSKSCLSGYDTKTKHIMPS